MKLVLLYLILFGGGPLGTCFAHKGSVCCLRRLEPSEKGGFSPAHCISVLPDLPDSLYLCINRSAVVLSRKGLHQGQASEGCCSNNLRTQVAQCQSLEA